MYLPVTQESRVAYSKFLLLKFVELSFGVCIMCNSYDEVQKMHHS